MNVTVSQIAGNSTICLRACSVWPQPTHPVNCVCWHPIFRWSIISYPHTEAFSEHQFFCCHIFFLIHVKNFTGTVAINTSQLNLNKTHQYVNHVHICQIRVQWRHISVMGSQIIGSSTLFKNLSRLYQRKHQRTGLQALCYMGDLPRHDVIIIIGT